MGFGRGGVAVGGECLDQERRRDGLGVRRECLDDARLGGVSGGGIHRAGDGEAVEGGAPVATARGGAGGGARDPSVTGHWTVGSGLHARSNHKFHRLRAWSGSFSIMGLDPYGPGGPGTGSRYRGPQQPTHLRSVPDVAVACRCVQFSFSFPPNNVLLHSISDRDTGLGTCPTERFG